MTNTIAVVGTYRSGTSLIASWLHNLGVDMGQPFLGSFYEPKDLVAALCRWWPVPELSAAESAANRAYRLRQWLESRNSQPWIGAKHPLLTLCVADIERAWGKSTKFVWCHRSLEESIQSLEQLNCWPQARSIQQRLYTIADSLFPRRNGVVVEFHDAVSRPEWTIQSLIEFLGIEPTEEQWETALQSARLDVDSWKKQTAFGKQRSPTYRPASTSDQGGVVATLICGNSPENIQPAIMSIRDLADRLVLIDSGSDADSVAIAKRWMGDRVVARDWTWQDDFSAARNFALDCAAQESAAWALALDTDERLDFGSIASRDELRKLLDGDSQVDAWLVDSANGNNSKERFIRIPTHVRWRGRCHPWLSGDRTLVRKKLRGVRLAELSRSPVEIKQKLQRDLRILREDVHQTPGCGRSWYYLGQTLVGLQQLDQAIEAFDKCATTEPLEQLSAWACFQSAKCLSSARRYDEAIERCAIGLAIDPETPELAWMSGWCCLQRNWDHRAIAWAKMAVALGAQSNPKALQRRLGFRDLMGWYEGPLEILATAYARLGDEASSQAARKAIAVARTARESALGTWPSR